MADYCARTPSRTPRQRWHLGRPDDRRSHASRNLVAMEESDVAGVAGRRDTRGAAHASVADRTEKVARDRRLWPGREFYLPRSAADGRKRLRRMALAMGQRGIVLGAGKR